MYTAGGGSKPIADQGTPDLALVRQTRAATRAARPRPLTALPADVTDLRVYRVEVSNTLIGLRLSP